MTENPVLAHIALGYSPMLNRQREVIATRLTVFPEQSDAVPDAQALLDALQEVWPAPQSGGELKLTLRPLDPASVKARSAAAQPAAAAASAPPVSLNITGEAFLRAVMDAAPPPHLMLEVPAFMVANAAMAPLLRSLRDAGSVLLIKGRPLVPLEPEVLACFSHCIVDASDERRTGAAPATVVRQVSTVQSGTRTLAEVDLAFERGAVAVLGWQLDDPLPQSSGRTKVATDIQVVMELISGVERELPVARLEDVLRRDPTLAFRLLRYLNSPAFGLSAEINSFGHAIMMLGYQRLKRWLALLLATSTKGPNAKSLMHAAVCRGLLMEELARGQGDADLRGEMFICGVFSLLDRLLQQPFADLLGSVPVPERVQRTLCEENGPFEPHLALVRAVEQESVYDIRECSDKLMMGPAELNRAVLIALRGARQLQS